jgi:hypothetical protein
MQDVEHLRAELEAMTPEDRTQRIREAQKEALAAERAGRADPAAIAELDKIAQLEEVDRQLAELKASQVDALRDRIRRRLAQAVAELDRESLYAEIQLEARVESLCNALDAIDRVWRREQAATPVRATPPPKARQELFAAVWNATQEAGAPTAAGDAAVQVLRDAFGDDQ